MKANAKGYAYIALATVLFSSMEIALKTVAGVFNPLQLNFLRFTIGGLFLLPFAIASLRKRGASIASRDWAFFALSGLACVVVSMSLYQLAIQYCKASIVAILFSCNPAFVLPLAAIFLKERIRAFSVATMVASLAGMLCIVNPLGGSAEVGSLGLLLSVGSAIAFAVYGVMGKTRSGRIGGLATTAFSFLAGSLELLALIAASRIPALASALRGAGLGAFAEIPVFSGLSPAVLPVFAYISLCVTGLGFASYFMAIEETSASTAAIVFYIKPALAPVLALLILGEAIAPSTLAGIALIAAGSALSIAGARLKR
jgi:drug/metabolite transporter (DMT)-like permease